MAEEHLHKHVLETVLQMQRDNSMHGDESFELSRPIPAPGALERQQFEENMASSELGGNPSDGLIALLRDHPDLVSSELARDAGEVLQPATKTRSTSHPGHSYTSTPHETGYVSSTLFPGPPCVSPSPPDDSLTGTQPFAFPEKIMYNHARGASNHIRGPSISRRDSPNLAPNLGQKIKPGSSGERIVVAMVGLPARGKSYLSNKLMRYLRWREYKVKVFNVGQLRRVTAQHKEEVTGVHIHTTATFFDPHNAEGVLKREELANECLEQLIAWLNRGGNVGVHDATNTTKQRRKHIADRVAQESGIRLIFLESICTDPDVIANNIAVKARSNDPDYNDRSVEEAKQDFMDRIKNYEAVYEPLDEDGTERNYHYCKIVDVGRSATMNLMGGYLESQIAFYLMNLHITPRNIFFSRHGESQFNVEGKIGGDSDLSERGQMYAQALPKLIHDHLGEAPLTVWHSSLRRTGQTARFLQYPKLVWNSLDELDAGVCDSMTYEEIEKYYPEDSANRDEDKFNYRYRGGESYRDVLVRLEPVIMELERQTNILIISHQAIIRSLYAYFMGLDQDELPYVNIPLHTVIKLTPKAYGCDEEHFQLPIEAVNTHRARPASARRVEEDDVLDGCGSAATTLPPTQTPNVDARK